MQRLVRAASWCLPAAASACGALYSASLSASPPPPLALPLQPPPSLPSLPPPPPPSPPPPPDWQTRTLLAGLRAILGEDAVLSSPEDTAAYARDAHSYHAGPPPTAVARAGCSAHVTGVVRLCGALGVPLVARGGGTSLEGHTTPPASGRSVVLDLSRLDRVLAVRPGDMDATAQAGVTWGALNAAAAPHGLMFAVDPGPGACLGGMVATGCSGTNAARYGVMRANTLSLRAVAADGGELVTGGRARKSSAGYDLTSLLHASEGTLGIVTEVTVRLHPLPAALGVAAASFESVRAACAAVGDALRAGLPLAAAELLDEAMVATLNEQRAAGLPRAPTVLFKLSGSAPAVAADAAALRAIVCGAGSAGSAGGGGGGGGVSACAPGGARNWVFSSDARRGAELWEARKVALWAAAEAEPGRVLATTDVCVPLSALPELLAAMEAQVAAGPLAARVRAVAHAADGNAHHFIAYDQHSPEEVAEARRLQAALVAAALALDGTCTGEHGVGVGKVRFLRDEFSPRTLQAMRDIKRALDPQGLLNPGKKLPSEEGRA